MKNLFKKIDMKELKSIIVIVVVIFAFRSTFFEPFRIPSGSLIPTLNIGDFILTNKFAYGFKLPFSDMFSDPIYLTKFESPKRFDIIVFKYPIEPSQNFIKRVIGLPGDKVQLVNKNVFVNGKLVVATPDNGPETSDFAKTFDGMEVNFYKLKEENKEFFIQVTDRALEVDNTREFIVPEHKFFVMGDNRDFSADSRVWGFVPQENIKGKALVVWMSLTLPLLDESGLSFSPSRIGKIIR